MICSSSARSIVAGGMESMSKASYLLPRARSGSRLGHNQELDYLLYDGLEDGVKHQSMGYDAGLYAEHCDLTPEEAGHLPA